MSISITVKNTTGARFQMEITSLDETVSQFKHRLESESGIPAASQRLIFRGHILKDSQTFADIRSKHGLESGHSMHVVPAPSPNRSAAASAQNMSATPSNPSAPTNPSDGTTNPVGGTGGLGATGTTPGIAGLGGLGGMGGMGGGMGGVGGMGAQRGLAGMGLDDMLQMHQQMMRNPEQMQAMLNSPMMDSLMNNPEVARSLMMINPQMRELMERNPEVAHVFNDPSTFRQMVQMARNPSLLNEMLRNTDRQMANIEMMPGGFDALRRMHENIQAPLMDAAQGGFAGNNGTDSATTDANDNPFSSLFQPQNTPSNAPMPNPWAPNNGVPAQTGTTNRDPPAAQTSDAPNAFASLFQTPGAVDGGATPATNPSTAGAPGTMPQIPGLPPGMTPDRVFQMLENPMMQQLMQNILSDPQMFQAMISSNPQLQSMMRTNPELARVLQNPDILRTVLNPEVTRSLMRFQEALTRSGMGGGFGATPTPSQPSAGSAQTTQQPNGNANTGQNPQPSGAWPNIDSFMAMMNAMNGMNAGTGSGTNLGTNPVYPTVPVPSPAATERNATPATGENGAANPGSPPANEQTNGLGPDANQPNGAPGGWPNMEGFMAMMNAANVMAAARGMGSNGGAAPAQQLSQEQLEEMYSTQLAQLRDMGFLDKSMCLQALQQSQGNVSAAIENLLSRFGG